MTVFKNLPAKSQKSGMLFHLTKGKQPATFLEAPLGIFP